MDRTAANLARLEEIWDRAARFIRRDRPGARSLSTAPGCYRARPVLHRLPGNRRGAVRGARCRTAAWKGPRRIPLPAQRGPAPAASYWAAPADSGDDPDVDDVHRCCLIIDFVKDPDVA